MRIVNLEQFIAMPPGTVFAKYRPCVFEDLCIKGDSIAETRDFFYQQIVDSLDCSGSDEWSKMLFESEETGKSLPMDFSTEGRDGCFDPAQLFAVWERADVEALIARLKATL